MMKKLLTALMVIAILIASSAVLNQLSIHQEHSKTYAYKNQSAVVNISIPTYNQTAEGYPLGCEGVSLYMALKGKGYVKDVSLQEFMSTMPHADNPMIGYWGDETKGRKANGDKRTTIYPEPLAAWGDTYAKGHVHNIEGSTVAQLKEELDQQHVLVVYVTGSWKDGIWKTYDFGTTIRNNHALCLVGYSENGDYLVNDCSKGRGMYWVRKDVFEPIYSLRHMAVAVS